MTRTVNCGLFWLIGSTAIRRTVTQVLLSYDSNDHYETIDRSRQISGLYQVDLCSENGDEWFVKASAAQVIFSSRVSSR